MGNTVTSAVVITGGASGIGRGCATVLAEQGRNVALWDLQGDLARSTAAEIAAATGVRAIGLGVDVTDSSSFAAAIDASRAECGAIGGLVHAAGTVRSQSIGDLDEDGWDFVLDVNLRALPLLVQALHADLASTPGGAIVGIASIEAWIGNGAIPAYCASKAGMLGVVRSLSDRLGPEGIRINAVCPGYIETPMLAPTLGIPGIRERFVESTTLKRMGEPRDIGEPVAFLLSSGASFITGQSLAVDGGVLAVD